MTDDRDDNRATDAAHSILAVASQYSVVPRYVVFIFTSLVPTPSEYKHISLPVLPVLLFTCVRFV